MFDKLLEYKLQTSKEQWQQGEMVSGTLLVKNNGTETATIDKIQTILAYGNLKKIRAKDPKAFEVQELHVAHENLSLDAGEQKEYPWEFKLSTNCPITDKFASLYLLYGSQNNAWECGQLQLTIDLHSILQQFMQVLQTYFRFKVQSQKFKKGFTEIKLLPPKSQELKMVEHLLCQLSTKKDVIEVKYIFSMKILKNIEGEMKVQKEKKEFKQQFTPKQYQLFGGYFNHDGILKAIGEIIAQSENKFYT